MNRLVGILAILIMGNVAIAQQTPTIDPKIDVQLLKPVAGPRAFTATADADEVMKGQLSVGLMITYATNPFSVFTVDQNDMVLSTRSEVVKSIFAGELAVAYGLTKKVQLGLVVPGIFNMSGDGVDASSGMPGSGITVNGLGDVRLQGKFSLLRQNKVGLAAYLGLVIPTSTDGDAGNFIGDDTFSGQLRLAGDYRTGRWHFGVNTGVVLRKPREIFASEVGQQLSFAAGVNFRAMQNLAIVSDVFGLTDFALNIDGAPVEWTGGIKVYPRPGLSVTGGGGIGIANGIGAPRWRAFATVNYAPDTRDPDGDGIPNRKDRCPNKAEDKDGFEDSDGCPERDNDGDKHPDDEDKCPNQAEDKDGFEDGDGCPELDNDGDGLEDLADGCPMHPEDKQGRKPNDGCPQGQTDTDVDGKLDHEDACPDKPEDDDGFEDWDGCPELDNDGDKIADEQDACPLCPEDIDGTMDDDGCPDLDDDGDGIPDTVDRCPKQEETINGIDDGDGCPDSGGAKLVSFDSNRLKFKAAPTFEQDGTLRRAGEVIVDQAAAVMRINKYVTRWTVIVVSDNTTKTNAIARSVIERLTSQGMPISKIKLLKSNGPTKLAILKESETEDDPEGPEFSCPASAQISGRPAPAKKAPVKVDEPIAIERNGEIEVNPTTPAAPVVKPTAPTTEVDAKAPPAAKSSLEVFSRYQGVRKRVLFKRNSKTRLVRGTREIAAVADLLKKHPKVHLRVVAHTDSRKGKRKSLLITEGQAQTLVDLFVKLGVSPEQLTPNGEGQDEPIANNKRSRGRKANRRIEFVFTEK